MRAVLKRTLVILGYAVGSILVLLLLAYVVLLVINRNDQPPSDLVVEIKQRAVQRQREVADEDNAFTFLLGFGAERNEDALALGQARINWMRIAAPRYPKEDDPGRDQYDFRSQRTEAVAQLAKVCGISLTECATRLAEEPEVARNWIASESWLADRYQKLIEYEQYREHPPYDMLRPIPAFSMIFEARRVFFVRERLINPQNTRDAIELDLRFWRSALENADTVLMQMIVVSSIRQHFALGGFALSGLPSQLIANAIPQLWRKPLTKSERSMHRALEGEWMFFERQNNWLANEYADPWEIYMLGAEPSKPEQWLGAALNPLLQPQDLSNRHAQLMRDLAVTFDVPLSEMPGAIRVGQRTYDGAYEPFSSLYNPIGDIVMDITAGISLYHDYAARVSDLEGLRRAALLAAEFRAQEIDPGDVPQQLPQAELRNPYTNEPFEWDAEAGAIVFRGLERTSRGRHAIAYSF